MTYSMINLPELELLSQEETLSLIKMAQEGDKDALDKVVKHNLKLVLKATYRFKNTGYDLQDLFQTGVIGLIKAVSGFDADKGFRFSTYAVSKIIGEIRLHLRDDGPIKVSRSIKKIARDVRSREEELKKELNRSPTIGELAEDTGYTREEIVQAFEAGKNPTSIYQPINREEDNELYLVDSIEDDSDKKYDKLELIEVIKNLDDRSRKIIYLRYFEDKTQQEIADYLGISQVQVSRLEKKILIQLRDTL